MYVVDVDYLSSVNASSKEIEQSMASSFACAIQSIGMFSDISYSESLVQLVPCLVAGNRPLHKFIVAPSDFNFDSFFHFQTVVFDGLLAVQKLYSGLKISNLFGLSGDRIIADHVARFFKRIFGQEPAMYLWVGISGKLIIVGNH